ncbi:MAG TPA: MFS transporter [Syntrophales bacterium]|nr:MFS transporter [Syntrophales bacterium]HNS54757.1 MFS transporter [Syntrophales bacterium]
MTPSDAVRGSKVDRRWVLFAAVSVLFGLSMFYRSAIAVLAPDLLRDVPMDVGTLGLVSAAFFYTYALFQIPGGLLLDRFDPARVMTAFYGFALAGVILFSVAESPGVLILGRLLTGAGMACGFIGALKILSLKFPPDRFATLSGIIVSVGNLGIVFATTPLVLWAQGLGWRTTFGFVGIVHLALVLAFFLSWREGRGNIPHAMEGGITAPDGMMQGLRLALQDRQVRLISASAFIRYGILAAVQGLWGGPYLMDVMGCSPVTAGNLLFLLTLGVIIGNPATGFLSDRVLKKRKGIVVVALAGCSLVLAALAFVPVGAPRWVPAALFSLFGLFAGTGSLPYAHLKELTPPERSATALTVLNFSAVVGAGVFMQGLGVLLETLHPTSALSIEAFRDAFLACAACMAAATALYGSTRESLSGPGGPA